MGMRTRMVEPASMSLLLVLCVLTVLSNIHFVMMPAFVGGVIDHFDASPSAVGLVASLEMASSIVVTAAMMLLNSRISIWKCASWGLGAMMAGNLLSAIVPSVELLGPCRFLSGLGAAMVIVAESRAAARLPNPGLAFGLMASARALFGISGYLLFFWAMGRGGLSSIYLALAAMAGLLIPLSRQLGRFGQIESPTRGFWPNLPWRQWLFAFSLLVYFIGHAALWGYVNRIGVSAGLDGQVVALALSASSATAFLGAGLAAIWCLRYPAVAGLGFAIAVGLIGGGLLLAGGSAVIFTVGVAAISLSSTMAGALYLGALSRDETGEDGVTAGALAFSLAWTAGPLLGALILLDGGYGLVTIFMFAMTALAAIPVAHRWREAEG